MARETRGGRKARGGREINSHHVIKKKGMNLMPKSVILRDAEVSDQTDRVGGTNRHGHRLHREPESEQRHEVQHPEDCGAKAASEGAISYPTRERARSDPQLATYS